MAANVDDATDPVSKAVALNISTGHVAPGTLKNKLPECSVDTLQYGGKYKFPYELLHIRRDDECDRESLTPHVETLNSDLEQCSETDISSESSLLRASINHEPPNDMADTEPGLHQQVRGGGGPARLRQTTALRGAVGPQGQGGAELHALAGRRGHSR